MVGEIGVVDDRAVGHAQPHEPAAGLGEFGEWVPLPPGWYRVSAFVSDAACEPAEPMGLNCDGPELFDYLEVAPE